MFANRFTAFVDACSLAGAVKRNLILSLAEGEFFRLRWSEMVLDETQKAIEEILRTKGDQSFAEKAVSARMYMQEAFEDAIVDDYESFLCVGEDLPDEDDAHILAAALKTQAQIIITDNLPDFPSRVLVPLNIEALSTDQFLANTIDLNSSKAVAVLREMRLRLKRPEMTAEALLMRMDAVGLSETVNILRPHIDLL